MEGFVDFEKMFLLATGHRPFPYQFRLAEGERFPHLLRAPTGSGKTAAIILSWIYRRRFHHDPEVRRSTPRRLVYCLPMRVLVEQVRDSAAGFLKQLGITPDPSDSDRDGVGLYTLMGGEVEEDWEAHPEQDVILLGTQDMLLSRALNRGYAANRYRWPVAYGLLNNDVLWVMDEVQLMGAGRPTSAQLQAFRKRWGSVGPVHTVWMSATLRSEWLATPDFQVHSNQDILEPCDDDLQQGLARVVKAPKTVGQLDVGVRPTAKTYPARLAGKILDLHNPGTQTLTMVNTVDRAVSLYRELSDSVPDGQCCAEPELLLLHSRMRPPDRRERVEQITDSESGSGGRIIVSTQVLEAGVDISSKVLVSEHAPWPSMVQRMGRCNRYGEHESARVLWIDMSHSPLPYEKEEMSQSLETLGTLTGESGAPADLPAPRELSGDHDIIHGRDLRDLFDTTSDLSGNDIDVSRFIRHVDERDVQAAWRQWPEGEAPPEDWPSLDRDELCPVPIQAMRDHLSARGDAWYWSYLDRRWVTVPRGDLWPGQMIVLRDTDGGYEEGLGWDPSARRKVPSLEPSAGLPAEASGDDPTTFLPGVWQTLEEHACETEAEAARILDELADCAVLEFRESVLESALWHDLGKAHPVFQGTLLAGLSGEETEERAVTYWAKAGGSLKRHSRRHFRHELASLLALIAYQEGDVPGGPQLDDLALYLVASHHGRVRLSIRSLSNYDSQRRSGSSRRILGIDEGDVLPRVTLGSELQAPEVSLILQPADIGAPLDRRSWLERAIQLRDDPDLGPFRLGYLEAVMRAADVRASRRAAEGRDDSS